MEQRKETAVPQHFFAAILVGEWLMSTTKAKIQYLIALLFFGTTGLVLRWTIIPSEIMVFCRGLFGALIILGYTLLSGKKPSAADIKRNLFWLILGGVSLGLNWVFLFAAYRYTTVALASLCNYTAPIIVILLSPILFRDKLTVRKLICVLSCAVGIALVSGVTGGESGSLDVTGLALGMGASAGFVGIIVCNKKLKEISPFDRVIVQLLVSAATVLPYVLFQNWGKVIPWDAASIFWMLILALLYTGVAYTCYFSAMGTLPVLTIALWGYLEPVVSVLCSAFVLGEALGLSGFVGAALVIGAAIAGELWN